LFVCTGNVCRSPTAERLAVAYAARSNFQDFTASSAGVRALTGHQIQPSAARVIEELGGDTSHFAARQLTSAMVASADLVLTMTRAHRADVLKLAPQQLHRTFTLREAVRLASECNARNVAELAGFRPQFSANAPSDIPDPIGQNEAFFEMVGAQISDLLQPVLDLCQGG
jgi:protein-tyrosine phosphatase